MLDTYFLCRLVYLPGYLGRRLRRRHIHCRQSDCVRQMEWPDRAQTPLEILTMDFCGLYHPIFRPALLSMASGNPGDERRWGGSELS